MPNLVDNAIKYGKSAYIMLAVSKHTASVRVMDCGPGIAEGQLGARAVSRMHGGDVVLSNAPSGDLLALVTIPWPTCEASTELHEA